MKLTGLNTVEELTIQNMKLQYQLDKLAKLKDSIDHVVINGKQVAFAEFISDTVGITPEAVSAAKRAEYSLISERIRNTLNIVADEFSSVLLAADLDRKDMDMRVAKRKLAVDAYALIQARTCLNQYAGCTSKLLELDLITQDEADKTHGVKAIVDTICEHIEGEREDLYTKMLVAGAQILQAEILANYTLPIFKAGTAEELNVVFNKVISEMEINIGLLNQAKEN